MSDRGLLLALQRLHDDPGFVDMVAENPDQTLGLYDLSDDERNALSQAATNKDDSALRSMAGRLGMDWTADHIVGAGALGEHETSSELEADPVKGVHGPNAFTGNYNPGGRQRPPG